MPVSAAGQALPIDETREATCQQELIAAVQHAYETEAAIYPIGGATSLDYGMPATRRGIGLDLSKMNHVVDYPARDMTITVEAGIGMRALAQTLAAQGQQLPVDVPSAERATLGGVVATDFNGPRRFGWGTLRDHVIGIHAVDGRGMAFQGGGRVVKNVAGYDFCKLLTGSLGTLGVISRLTLRLKPCPDKSLFVVGFLPDLEQAEHHLAALVGSRTNPAAVELLMGPAWKEEPLLPDLAEQMPTGGLLLVGLEGSQVEVDWMTDQLTREWRQQGMTRWETLDGPAAKEAWDRLARFPAEPGSPLVLKASLLPSHAAQFIQAAQAVDPECSIQAHAGNGIVVVRLSQLPDTGLSRALVGKLQVVAARAQGNVVVLSNPTAAEMTRRCTWGHVDASLSLMSSVKAQFDPKNILNPGRFIYP